jgi:hypothetical protein
MEESGATYAALEFYYNMRLCSSYKTQHDNGEKDMMCVIGNWDIKSRDVVLIEQFLRI